MLADTGRLALCFDLEKCMCFSLLESEKVFMAMRFIGCAMIDVVPHYALLCYTVYAMLCLEFSRPN